MRVVVMAACGLLSVFLLASGYEDIFNRDLPFVNTLEPVNLTALGSRFNLYDAAQKTPDLYGDFGKPQTLKMPERTVRVDIAPAILQDQTWLARVRAMHLLITKPPRNGNIGVAVLYCRTGISTLSSATLPSVGGNLFMDTDKNWRYVYRVVAARAVSADQPYVVADNGTSGKLIIICYDSGAKNDELVEANLLSVQGVAQ